MPDETHIRWDYEGKPDPLMGTGATRAERSLVWIAGLAMLVNFIWLAYVLFKGFLFFNKNKRAILQFPEMKMDFGV